MDFEEFTKVLVEKNNLYPECTALAELKPFDKDKMYFCIAYHLTDNVGFACVSLDSAGLQDKDFWQILYYNISTNKDLEFGPKCVSCDRGDLLDQLQYLRGLSASPPHLFSNLIAITKDARAEDFSQRLAWKLLELYRRTGDTNPILVPLEVWSTNEKYTLALEYWYEETYPQHNTIEDGDDFIPPAPLFDKLKALKLFGETTLVDYKLHIGDLFQLIYMWYRYNVEDYTLQDELLRLISQLAPYADENLLAKAMLDQLKAKTQ